MTKQKKTMPWDELRVYDDNDDGRVTFDIVFHNANDSYVSEIYGVGKGETADQAALAVCRRYGWDKERPGPRSGKRCAREPTTRSWDTSSTD